MASKPVAKTRVSSSTGVPTRDTIGRDPIERLLLVIYQFDVFAVEGLIVVGVDADALDPPGSPRG